MSVEKAKEAIMEYARKAVITRGEVFPRTQMEVELVKANFDIADIQAAEVELITEGKLESLGTMLKEVSGGIGTGGKPAD
jgi:hypothetical protein